MNRVSINQDAIKDAPPYHVVAHEYRYEGQRFNGERCCVEFELGETCICLHMAGPAHVIALGRLIEEAGRDLAARRVPVLLDPDTNPAVLEAVSA